MNKTTTIRWNLTLGGDNKDSRIPRSRFRDFLRRVKPFSPPPFDPHRRSHISFAGAPPRGYPEPGFVPGGRRLGSRHLSIDYRARLLSRDSYFRESDSIFAFYCTNSLTTPQILRGLSVPRNFTPSNSPRHTWGRAKASCHSYCCQFVGISRFAVISRPF